MKKPIRSTHQERSFSSVTSAIFIVFFIGLALILTVVLNTTLVSQKMTTQSRAAGTLSYGENCGEVYGPTCANGLTCTDHVCRKNNGADCYNNIACASGYCDAEGDGVCKDLASGEDKKPLRYGDYCGEVYGPTCANGLTCTDHVCKVNNGGYCDSNTNCISGLCKNDICVDPAAGSGGGDECGSAGCCRSQTDGVCTEPATEENCPNGHYVSNYCGGGANRRCCVPGGWGGGGQYSTPQTSTPQYTTPQQPVVKKDLPKPGANDPRGVVDQNDGSHIRGWAFDPDDTNKSLEIHVYIYPAGGAAEGKNLGPTTIDRSDVNDTYGIHGYHGFDWEVDPKWCNGTKYTADVFAINTGAGGNLTIGGATWSCGTANQQTSQQSSSQKSTSPSTPGKTTTTQPSCKALKVPDLDFNDVLPAKTSAIDWPEVVGAVRYQIRLDDPADPWSDPCSNPNSQTADICDENIAADSPKTTYTFSPGFQIREKPYHFSYAAVNSCGAVSNFGEGYIKVIADTSKITPSPTPSPASQTAKTPTPTPSASSSKDPLKFVPVPSDIPPLCPDVAKEPDLVLPKTIDAGQYMIQFADAPAAGSTFGLIIDDLSNGTLTDCKNPTVGDICADVAKSEYGPVAFVKGKTYRVSYFEKKACGRASYIAQYEVKVQ